MTRLAAHETSSQLGIRRSLAVAALSLTVSVVWLALAAVSSDERSSSWAAAPAAKPAEKPDAKAPAKADAKADPKSEPKADPKTDPKSEPKAEPKSTVNPELDPKALEAHEAVRKLLRDLLGGVRSNEEFQTRWKEKGAEFTKQVLAFLKEHPQYETGQESMMDLAIRMSTRLSVDDFAVAVLSQIRDANVGKPLGKKADDALLDLRKRADARAQIGKVVNFEFVPVGKTEKVSVASLRGKVVVIYFWAAWCDLCNYATEDLKRLYEQTNKAGEQKMEVIAVSIDDDRGLVEETIKNAKIPWLVQYDGRLWKNEIAAAFAADSIPRVLVLDKTGKLVDIDRRADLETRLPKLLAEKYEPTAEPKK